MKTLQNNFTTPEQSKRLLELGIPADSANMWWEKDETIRINGEWVHGAAWSKVPSPFNWDRENNRFYTYSEIKETVEDFTGNETLPCWSLGRLIEIIIICDQDRFNYNVINNTHMITEIIADIKCAIEKGKFEFSKLEEYTRHQNN
jgi:hypothetical protein